MDTDDDLLIVRNILHINMSICLLIAQFLFFFSINQIKSQVENKKIDFFKKQKSSFSLVRLSNNRNITSLFSSCNIFLDVCRWN
jgi:hypothetical protein